MSQRGDVINCVRSRGTLKRPGRGLRSAFTLIEVLIVLVIVLAIGGIVAVNLLPRRDQAIEQTVRVQLQMIEQALEQFYFDFGRYPTEEEGLAVLWDRSRLTDERLAERHPGNYFAQGQRNLRDHWGNPFGYRLVDEDEFGEATGQRFEIWSNGRDGEEGTDDDIFPRDVVDDVDEF